MKKVVIGLLGSNLDSGRGPERWERWRSERGPVPARGLLFTRFEMLYERRFSTLADQLAADIAGVAPETQVNTHAIELRDAWDFEDVYGVLYDFARRYPFDPEHEEYYVHITTGTHVAQICLFLLAESRHIPGRLVQTSPPARHEPNRLEAATASLTSTCRSMTGWRCVSREKPTMTFLSSGGIETRNAEFNRLIEQIERVALRSAEPLLLDRTDRFRQVAARPPDLRTEEGAQPAQRRVR